ncbi:RlmE family RNA methyltransferase [Desulfocurvibacter africanus]|uniref:RlmE family RNA methyltransferase n=1 Tax=Desulfocurvibacter africanus TaxID=873 RepID=UPI00040D311C|nr:RlmE family RNA methyltransferase [Desulfocurvibacter africanus]
MKKYQDHYFKQAKKDNYPARSVYKLQEINKRFGILRPGQKVLDLGAAPGSWTLFAAKVVGQGGKVLGVDLQSTATDFPDNVRFLVGDVFEPPAEVQAAMEELAPFEVVVSDMAPKTSGIIFRDQAFSFDLCVRALEVADKYLAKGGNFVAKIFEGPDVRQFAAMLRERFVTVKNFKPQSSRSESKETFYIGLGFKGAPEAPAQDQIPV